MPKKIAVRINEFAPWAADLVFKIRKRFFLSDTPRRSVFKTVMASKIRAGVVFSGARA